MNPEKWTDNDTEDNDNNDVHSKYRIFFLWLKYEEICVLNHLDTKFGIFHLITFPGDHDFRKHICVQLRRLSIEQQSLVCTIHHWSTSLAHLFNSVVASAKSQDSVRLGVWLVDYPPRISVLM